MTTLTLMLLPSVSVFPAMVNGGRPEGGSVQGITHREREEEEDYSKLLHDCNNRSCYKAVKSPWKVHHTHSYTEDTGWQLPVCHTRLVKAE